MTKAVVWLLRLALLQSSALLGLSLNGDGSCHSLRSWVPAFNMFPTGHHYSTNFNQAQSQQHTSEQRSYTHLQSSSSHPLHRGNPSQNEGYPSSIYSRQQHYGLTSSLSGESTAKYDYRWSEGTHTNITGQAHQGVDQSGPHHHASHGQETAGARTRAEPPYDTRGLGSLAYASGLDVAALGTNRSASTGPANYPLPATTASERYRRDSPGLGSVSSVREITVSQQSPLPSNTSSYANGSITYSQPARGSHNLPSVHQTYSVSDMGNTPSARQVTSQHVRSKSGSEREYTISMSKELGPQPSQNGTSVQHSGTSPSYQGYRPSQSSSSLHQGKSNSIMEYHLQHSHRDSPVIPSKTGTSESHHIAPLPSKSPDQHTTEGTTQYNQPVQNGTGRSNGAATALEPRTASPFHIRHYQPHHGRTSPLNQTHTTQDYSGKNTTTAFIPTTVDPSQVYNPPYEYQRQAAVAEAKAAERTVPQVEDAITPSLATENANSARRSGSTENHQSTFMNSVGSSSENPGPNEWDTAHADAAVRNTPTSSKANPPENAEDMELQMRIMVEKMRKYQAMDPTKFARVWEEVKKVNTACYMPFDVIIGFYSSCYFYLMVMEDKDDEENLFEGFKGGMMALTHIA